MAAAVKFRDQIFPDYSHANALLKALEHFKALGEDEQKLVDEMDADGGVRFGYIECLWSDEKPNTPKPDAEFRPTCDEAFEWRTVSEEFGWAGKRVSTPSDANKPLSFGDEW